MRARGIHKSSALTEEKFSVDIYLGRRGQYFVSIARVIVFFE